MEKYPPLGRFYSSKDFSKINNFVKKRNYTPDREKYQNNEDRTFRESLKNFKFSKKSFLIRKNINDPDDDSIIFSSNYSFLTTYSKFKQNKISEKLKFDFKVKISNYIIKETDLNLFSHVKYTLEGYLEGREFSVERRYKEFLAYRKLLIQNFPGLFIPPIPPKKDLGNLEENFIKLRKKFLQQFFNKISLAPHLSASHDTKVFLEPKNKNYLDVPFEIYFKSIKSIYDYYSQYFEFLIERDLTKFNKNSIHDFYLKLNKTKKQLEDILFITTESINLKLENDRTTLDFYEYFYDFDNSYIYDMFKVDKETRMKFNNDLIECGLIESMYARNYKNSFETFYDWANSELMDVNAMIECVSSVYKYQEMFDKKFNRLQDENEDLNKITNPNFLNSFLFTHDLKNLETKTVQVKNLKDEVLLIKRLIDLLYKILYYVEIPTFKRDKMEFYNKFIFKLVENEKNYKIKNEEIFNFIFEHGKNILDLYSLNKKK